MFGSKLNEKKHTDDKSGLGGFKCVCVRKRDFIYFRLYRCTNKKHTYKAKRRSQAKSNTPKRSLLLCCCASGDIKKLS